MTELQLGLRFQMFGQPYVTGLQNQKKLERVGSDTILALPEGSVFDIKSPGGDIIKVIENVKFQMELVAQNNHLSIQFAQDGGETPSGIALKIKDLERFEDYQDDLELWKMYEKDLYFIEREIADYNGIRLPEAIKLDFNEPEYPKTMQDQILWDNHRLQNNLTTQAKLMVEYNDDLSLQEAESIVAENKQQNEQQSIFERIRQQNQRTQG